MKRFRWLRTLFRLKKRIDPVNEFLNKTLPAIDSLERDGKLLLVNDERPGIVLSHELAQYFNMCYVTRMQHYTKTYGLESFFNARNFIPSFARRHNPDEELLNLCINARMAINFRMAALVKQMDEDWCELKSDEPLFLTFMNEELTAATHTGYEVNGIVELNSAG